MHEPLHITLSSPASLQVLNLVGWRRQERMGAYFLPCATQIAEKFCIVEIAGKKTSAAHAQLISGLKMMQCTCWWFHSTPAQHIQLLLLPYRALYFSHCMIFETHCTFWVHFLCFSTLFLVLYRLLNLTPFNMAHVFSLAGWFRNPGCKKLCYVLINTIWFSGPNWKVVACKTFNSKQSWFNSCEEHSN